MVLKNRVWLYAPMVFEAGVVCADIKSPPQVTKPDGVANGGVIFWALDYNNYYVAGLYVDGTYDTGKLIEAGSKLCPARRLTLFTWGSMPSTE